MIKRTKSIWHQYKEQTEWIDSLPECSMYELARKTVDKHPENCAIEFEGKKTSYKELFDQIDIVAKALIANGVKKGDIVSILSINTPFVVSMIYAVNRIGAVANMLHPLLSPAEIKKFIQDTNSVAVLTVEQIYPKVKMLEWDNGLNPTVIVSRIVDALPTVLKPLYLMKNKMDLEFNPAHNTMYWNDFVSSKKTSNITLPADEGTGPDLAMIMYSGGTSGTPKGVMLSNSNLNSYAVISYETTTGVKPVGKKTLAILPLFHGFGFGSCIHSSLTQGVHIFLLPKFDFEKSIDLVFKKKINFINAVPAFYEALIRSPHMDNNDLSFLENLFCGGDKLRFKLRDKLIEKLAKGNSPSAFFEGYGQTECVAGCVVTPHFASNPRSVGMALPDVQIKLVKPDTFEEVPVGEDGELCVCSPMVMMGYYNNEAETKHALRVHPDGKTWLHTGDLLSRDEEGFYYFKQRLSRMIISSGYNVYVTQMEKIISECDEIEACCVVGVPDRVVGQKIKACVVAADKTMSEEAIKDIVEKKCQENLAEYSQPHEICIINKLPMTHLGKVNYRALEN